MRGIGIFEKKTFINVFGGTKRRLGEAA